MYGHLMETENTSETGKQIMHTDDQILGTWAPEKALESCQSKRTTNAFAVPDEDTNIDTTKNMNQFGKSETDYKIFEKATPESRQFHWSWHV